MVLRVIVNDERAFFVEGRIIGGQLALPVMTILRELRLKCQVENSCLTMKSIGAGKTVVLYFKENHALIDGKDNPVGGGLGENDYYLALSDWVYLLGTVPVWLPDEQDIKITVMLTSEQETGTNDTNQEHNRIRTNPFQPVNRLDLFLTGRGDGYAMGHTPGWDYSDLSLEWRTYGTIWGGRLTLGGKLEWEIEPDEDWDFPFTVYRWDRDTAWGRLTLGTQTLDFRESYPKIWDMRGVSLTDRRYWDGSDRSTNIVGTTSSGNKAELWLGEWLINTTEIKNGEYRFTDIWLPSYKVSQLLVVIKEEEQVVDRQSVQYIPGELLFAKGDYHYIFAIGQTEDEEEYYSWAGTGEWVRGWTEDFTAGGLAIVNDDDQHQIGVNMAWRPRKNLIFQAETWCEPSSNAWRLGSDWGYNKVYLQGRAFHRDMGFMPIFPSEELGSEVDLAQLALYWYPTPGLDGIFAGEYVNEKLGWETKTSRLEASLNFRKKALQGTAYVMWKDEDEEPGERLRQNRLTASLIWDFKPNQWLEWGFDYSDLNYEISGDEKNQEAWLRWTNHSWARDRWMVGYGYIENESEDKQKIESRWNHQWSNEWSTYTGFAYGWGEEGVDYNDYLVACGLEYRMKNGAYLSLGYEWSVKQPEFGEDEYRQNLYLQISMGLVFGSRHPYIVPYGGDNQTTGTVSGFVYTDLNGNGHRDNGERGVNGIRVRINDLETAVTDAEGRYVFYNVSTGIHRLALDEATLPVVYNPLEHHRMIHVIAGASLKEDLGVLVVGAVSGRVFIDGNGNGKFDEGETPLAGVRVQTESGDVWTTTGKDGDYYIQLMAGDHRLVIDSTTLPSNTKAGSPSAVHVGDDGEEMIGMDLAVTQH